MRAIPALVGLGIGAWVLQKLSKAGSASTLNFVLSGISVSWGWQPTIHFNVKIQNPSNQSFNVLSLVGSADLNGQYLANVSSFKQVTIAPHAETAYTVDATVSLTDAISQLISIINGSSQLQAAITIKGNVNLDQDIYPLNLTYKVI